jgi:hypothetical protein
MNTVAIVVTIAGVCLIALFFYSCIRLDRQQEDLDARRHT